MEKKNVIIDCDPSADDAIALMLALSSPELNVIGITAASGVCPSDQSAINALKILKLCEKTHISVAKGASQPLKRKMVFEALYCGADGMSETWLAEPECSVCPQPAHEFIIKQAQKYSGGIHIISIAPMTNIALAILQAPEITKHISSVITSSGSYGVGQETGRRNPRPTWNIEQDPEAAKIVMESGILIEAIGFDVSSRFHNHMTDLLMAYGDINKPSKAFFRKAVTFNLRNGLEPFSLLVDASAVAYAVHPGIAKMVKGKVAVETCGELTTGQTLFGTYGYLSHMKSKIKAAYQFDQNIFLKMLSERVFG